MRDECHLLVETLVESLLLVARAAHTHTHTRGDKYERADEAHELNCMRPKVRRMRC